MMFLHMDIASEPALTPAQLQIITSANTILVLPFLNKVFCLYLHTKLPEDVSHTSE